MIDRITRELDGRVDPSEVACRLCGGRTDIAFSKLVLGTHDVKFFQCLECDSLQSEVPYWLDQAYQSALAGSDTGAVFRSLRCQAAILALSRIIPAHGIFIDYGGGGGLLCRLLRDCGLDAYVSDKYADAVYAKTFVIDPDDFGRRQVKLISAIEVFEHCVHPASELGALFAVQPEVILGTTVLYSGEGRDWWYLGANVGQHVFFYSPRAMEWLAHQYGYEYVSCGDFHLFFKTPLGSMRRWVLRGLLTPVAIRGISGWIATTHRGRFCDADHRAILEKSGATRR